ncbi:enoyl-CoA hydratase/isomerase family protein [Natronolimnohabitans innermongolicus]|uniref:Enoyl-CoA hydratase/isomerase n=1 Tax=Natronolimnohabitans innermongolicus JCM 12255 TaxID=1227499 RepID=L9WM53_9EURY|nr:enoyl-CoA hydratase/isomerase family protein [Natronolimnohabitans innermongolicus]ELY50472.1 Enoyl-CoA hydratase/isomerase [Natronolimnohabitans innermongolicus JCM 12255]
MSVTVDRDPELDTVAHVRLDFGDLNLLSPGALVELNEGLATVPDDASVVTVGPDASDADGDVGGLTAGLKLDEVRDLSVSEARDVLTSLYEANQRVRDLEAITVCRCGEYALGGGLELAMSCDFRIATDDAVLGLPEIDAGLVTGIQGGLLVRLVGLQAAKELIYTGEPVSGVEAEELGLVNDAVSPSAYGATVDELVETLASKSPIIAARQTQVFRALRSNGIESGIDHSLETIAACFDTHDQHEAMTAFLEKREPAFEGR